MKYLDRKLSGSPAHGDDPERLQTIDASSPWSEDSLAAAQADAQDNAQGCNQLAVVITQQREPGFGSLATSSDLVTRVRSVGRIKIGPGGYAPAMLLLKRTGCPVLGVGASGGGASSWIHVRGALSSNGRAQPGTIHSDSDGTGCSSSVFDGKASDGIVTYAAPLVEPHRGRRHEARLDHLGRRCDRRVSVRFATRPPTSTAAQH